MMVASHHRDPFPSLVHGCAAELAAPDDQRGVEQASLFQIGHERGGGAIGFEAQRGDAIGDVGADARAVGVPSPVKS